jgi:hypothetical protein
MTHRDFHAETHAFLASKGIDTSSDSFDEIDVDDLRTMISQTFADEANLEKLFAMPYNSGAQLALGGALSVLRALRNDYADLIKYLIGA